MTHLEIFLDALTRMGWECVVRERDGYRYVFLVGDNHPNREYLECHAVDDLVCCERLYEFDETGATASY